MHSFTRTRNEHRLAPVDEAVVVGERDVHHRPHRRSRRPRPTTGALLDLVQPEDAGLRRVQDRRREQRAVDAAVRDRERAALEVVHRDPVLARLLRELADLLLDLGERERVGVADAPGRRAPCRRRPRRRCRSGPCRRCRSPRISAFTAGNARSASTAAFTKKDMKPSFTPCFARNASPCCSRSASTRAMSTSLKVVRIAAVCCASTSRRATVRRSGVIGTTRSRAAAPSRARGGRGRGRGGAGARRGAARSSARTTSSLRTWPPGPRAGDRAGVERRARPTRRRAPAAARSGAAATPARRARALRRGRRRGAPLPRERRARRRARCLAAPSPRAAARAPPGADREPSGAPRGLRRGALLELARSPRPPRPSSPVCFRTRASTPAAGAGTATVAFSLSTSTTGSSTWTRLALLLQPGADGRLRDRLAERRDLAARWTCASSLLAAARYGARCARRARRAPRARAAPARACAASRTRPPGSPTAAATTQRERAPGAAARAGARRSPTRPCSRGSSCDPHDLDARRGSARAPRETPSTSSG